MKTMTIQVQTLPLCKCGKFAKYKTLVGKLICKTCFDKKMIKLGVCKIVKVVG